MKAVKIFGAISLWLLAATAQAGMVTLVGDRVNYQYDDSQASLALLGTPMIVGDSVVFVPIDHRAISAGGAGPGGPLVDFVFDRVYATDGWVLSSLAVYQSGDYRISGGGSVVSAIDVDLHDNTSAAFGFDGGSVRSAGDSAGLQGYDLLLEVNVSALLGLTDDIEVSLDTEILADDDGVASQFAWIQDKLLIVAAQTSGGLTPPAAGEVPAPGVLLLMGLGLLVLRAVRR